MKSAIEKLLKTANNLDSMGLFSEANILTRLAYDFNNPEKEEIVDDSLINADEHEELMRILDEMSASGEIDDNQVKHIMEIVQEGNPSAHSWEKEELVDDSLAMDMYDHDTNEFKNQSPNAKKLIQNLEIELSGNDVALKILAALKASL